MNLLALILAPLTMQFIPTIDSQIRHFSFHSPNSDFTLFVKDYFSPPIENDYIEALKLHPDFFQLTPQKSQGPQSLHDLAFKKIMQNPHHLPRYTRIIPESIRNKIIDCMRTRIATIAKTELMRLCCYGLEDLNGKYVIDDQYKFICLPITSSTAPDADGITIQAIHSLSLNPSIQSCLTLLTKNYLDGTQVTNGSILTSFNTKNLAIKITGIPEDEPEFAQTTDMFYQQALDRKIFSQYTKKFKPDGTPEYGRYTLPFLSKPLSERELIFLFKLFAFRAYEFDFKKYDPSIHPSYKGLLKSPPETAEKLITQWNNSSERFACITKHQQANEEFNNQVIKAIAQASEKAQILQKTQSSLSNTR